MMKSAAVTFYKLYLLQLMKISLTLERRIAPLIIFWKNKALMILQNSYDIDATKRLKTETAA